MKILLFGKNGQVGWELQRSLAPLASTGELIAFWLNTKLMLTSILVFTSRCAHLTRDLPQ